MNPIIQECRTGGGPISDVRLMCPRRMVNCFLHGVTRHFLVEIGASLSLFFNLYFDRFK